MTNKATLVALTDKELIWLEEYLDDYLKDNLEDEETQALYIKVRVALGEDKSEEEKRIKELVADVRRDREYDEEREKLFAKLKEKYYPTKKAT